MGGGEGASQIETRKEFEKKPQFYAAKKLYLKTHDTR